MHPNYQGQVGTVKRFSNCFSVFLLNGLIPSEQVPGQGVDFEVSEDGQTEVVYRWDPSVIVFCFFLCFFILFLSSSMELSIN